MHINVHDAFGSDWGSSSSSEEPEDLDTGAEGDAEAERVARTGSAKDAKPGPRGNRAARTKGVARQQEEGEEAGAEAAAGSGLGAGSIEREAKQGSAGQRDEGGGEVRDRAASTVGEGSSGRKSGRRQSSLTNTETAYQVGWRVGGALARVCACMLEHGCVRVCACVCGCVCACACLHACKDCH